MKRGRHELVIQCSHSLRPALATVIACAAFVLCAADVARGRAASAPTAAASGLRVGYHRRAGSGPSCARLDRRGNAGDRGRQRARSCSTETSTALAQPAVLFSSPLMKCSRPASRQTDLITLEGSVSDNKMSQFLRKYTSEFRDFIEQVLTGCRATRVGSEHDHGAPIRPRAARVWRHSSPSPAPRVFGRRSSRSRSSQ